MSGRTTDGPVRRIDHVRPTMYGPADLKAPRWDAIVEWTDWTNGHGGDVAVTLGPHSSGSMRLSYEEVEGLLIVLHKAIGQGSPLVEKQ